MVKDKLRERLLLKVVRGNVLGRFDVIVYLGAAARKCSTKLSNVTHRNFQC
jgi:hypothetical protein